MATVTLKNFIIAPTELEASVIVDTAQGVFDQSLGGFRQLPGSFELIGRTCFALLEKHFPELRQPFSPLPEWAVLIELSDCGDHEALNDRLLEALAESAIEDAVLARSESDIEALWRLREEIPEAQKPEGASIKHDISVPVNAIPEFIARAGAAVDVGAAVLGGL